MFILNFIIGTCLTVLLYLIKPIGLPFYGVVALSLTSPVWLPIVLIPISHLLNGVVQLLNSDWYNRYNDFWNRYMP